LYTRSVAVDGAAQQTAHAAHQNRAQSCVQYDVRQLLLMFEGCRSLYRQLNMHKIIELEMKACRFVFNLTMRKLQEVISWIRSGAATLTAPVDADDLSGHARMPDKSNLLKELSEIA
jgi:hypothetical protein